MDDGPRGREEGCEIGITTSAAFTRFFLVSLSCLTLAACAGWPRSASPTERLIVISFDSVGASDRVRLENLPNFARFIRQGSYSFEVEGVFPSSTNPSHATIMTGRYPDAHGVAQNAPFDPGLSGSARYGYRRDIAGPTIFEAARSAGLMTATVLWPLSGGSSAIDLNFPEAVAADGESQILKMAFAGTSSFLFELGSRFGSMLDGTAQPAFDDFLTACDAYVIKEYRPNLLMTHFLEIDAVKHAAGIESPETDAAFERADARLGRILKTVEDSRLADSTVVMLVSDHGQFDVSRLVRLNALLADEGLVSIKNDAIEWRAWFRSAGGSAFLYAKDPDSEERALAALRRLADDPAYGIEAVLDRQALDQRHAGPGINWAVAGSPGTKFIDAIDGPVLSILSETAGRQGIHGYLPTENGYSTVFFAMGPGITKGLDLGLMKLVDEAPFMARILGLNLPGMVGNVPDAAFALPIY